MNKQRTKPLKVPLVILLFSIISLASGGEQTTPGILSNSYAGREPDTAWRTIPMPPTAHAAYVEALPEFLRGSNTRTNYWRQRFSTPDQYQSTMKDYCRLITGVDRAIGRIREELARRGQATNTVILFLSDHGDMMGDYLIGGKELLYEASLRIPIIVFDPRVPSSARGQRRSGLVLNIDIAPKALDLAGLPVPNHMQGRSLAPLVRGKRVAWRKATFHRDQPGNLS